MSLGKRDYSLDFVKGIAILSVILIHSSPHYYLGSIAWFGQAVPLFLIVTSYLTYSRIEKGESISSYFSWANINKMFNRISLPFLVMTIIQIVIYSFLGKFTFNRLLQQGGIGPGSYYLWLYLQFWILLPFIVKIIDSISLRNAMILFISISILLELMTNILEISAVVYRFLFYRYLLVVVLGCFAKKLNFKITMPLILLALLSLLFSLVAIYTSVNFKPFFTNMWNGYHWITAFYPLLLFLLIRLVYSKLKNGWIKSFVVKLGSYSYEILLCQMFVFSMFRRSYLSFVNNIYLEIMLYVAITTLLSILPVLIYKRLHSPKVF